MWELDYKESWALKNWCFWTGVLENTLESPLDYKEIQPVHPKGDQPWICIGGTDVEAETPILWPPDAKSWLIWEDPDVGKDWGQEEKGTTEDEIVGWYHRLNRHEFVQTLGVGDGQGGLVCCGPWGCRVRHNWATELNWREQTVGAQCRRAQVLSAHWAHAEVRQNKILEKNLGSHCRHFRILKCHSARYIHTVCMRSRFSYVWLFVTLRLQPTRLLCPWYSPGKHPGVGNHALLWGSPHPKDWTPVSCTASAFFLPLSCWGRPHIHTAIYKIGKQQGPTV